MTRWTHTSAIGTTLALLFLSTPSAHGGDCELEGPALIDPGMMQTLAMRCDEPFVGVVQFAYQDAFGNPVTLPVMTSQREGSDHRIEGTFRAPWGVDAWLDQLYVRGFALTLSGEVHATDVKRLVVGKGDRVYQPVTADRGLIAFEMESEQVNDDWIEGRYWDGYSGHSYIVWRGGNHYSNKNNGVIDYEFEINRPGEYALALHCFHYGGHLNNDVWMKIDNHSWEKIYSADEGVWTWKAEKEGGGPYKEQLSAGRHTLTIAARSEKFSIDRLHLFHTGDYNRREVENLDLPLSSHRYE